jgi:DNA-binding transcriptional LysR family regulator
MNLRNIDLNLLLVFEALMDERNVTRAARRVGLSQPALSNALARLRRTFDDPLLVRTTTGMTPTPVAQALISPVHAALTQLRAALEEKNRFNPAESARMFHILANDYVELALLPALLKELRARSTGVRLRLHRPRNLFEPPSIAALSESFDLAVGFYPDALALEAAIRSEILWEERNVCIASAKHTSIRGKISLRQYAAAEHVAVFYKAEGQGLIDTLLEQKGYTRQTALQLPHFISVPFAVAATNLIATVPERLALAFSKQLKLQVLSLPLTTPSFRLSLLWHARFHNDPAHRWMRELILAQGRAVV